jgi:hypothetical protein
LGSAGICLASHGTHLDAKHRCSGRPNDASIARAEFGQEFVPGGRLEVVKDFEVRRVEVETTQKRRLMRVVRRLPCELRHRVEGLEQGIAAAQIDLDRAGCRARETSPPLPGLGVRRSRPSSALRRIFGRRLPRSRSRALTVRFGRVFEFLVDRGQQILRWQIRGAGRQAELDRAKHDDRRIFRTSVWRLSRSE